VYNCDELDHCGVIQNIALISQLFVHLHDLLFEIAIKIAIFASPIELSETFIPAHWRNKCRVCIYVLSDRMFYCHIMFNKFINYLEVIRINLS
jgi:hypothetical protein